jgi:hypothetical protein
MLFVVWLVGMVAVRSKEMMTTRKEMMMMRMLVVMSWWWLVRFDWLVRLLWLPLAVVTSHDSHASYHAYDDCPDHDDDEDDDERRVMRMKTTMRMTMMIIMNHHHHRHFGLYDYISDHDHVHHEDPLEDDSQFLAS